MNILNQSPANGNGRSVFPASRGPRPSSHHLQHRHHDACHHQHLLPVPLTLPPPPASNTFRCLVQPSRSSCRPAPLVGDSNGGSSQRDEPLLIHRSADHGAVVNAQGRRHVRRSAVLETSMRDICNHLPHLQFNGGGEETEHSIKLPAEPATRYYHLSHHHLTEEEEEVKRKASAFGAADDLELGTRSGTSLGFVRSLMDDDKYFRLTQEYYHAPGSHLDRQRQHQQLFSPDHGEPPPVLTLAVSVSSAVKLETKQMDQIAKKMRKLTGFENLRMENTVDPSLIAGFVIRYGVDDAHLIDLSVKGRLAELEARLQSSDQSAGADGGWTFPGPACMR